jgi:hypothetical protein
MNITNCMLLYAIHNATLYKSSVKRRLLRGPTFVYTPVELKNMIGLQNSETDQNYLPNDRTWDRHGVRSEPDSACTRSDLFRTRFPRSDRATSSNRSFPNASAHSYANGVFFRRYPALRDDRQARVTTQYRSCRLLRLSVFNTYFSYRSGIRRIWGSGNFLS